MLESLSATSSSSVAFPDPWIAADQHKRARDYSAAEHAIEFFYSRRLPRVILALDLL